MRAADEPRRGKELYLGLHQKGAGWIDVEVRVGDTCHTFRSSWLVDSPRDLVDAMSGLLRGETTEAVTLVEEPGSILWLFTAISSAQVRFDALRLPNEMFATADDRNLGEPVFSVELPLQVLASTVLNSVMELVSGGGDSYAREWGHVLPGAELDELAHRLGIPRAQDA